LEGFQAATKSLTGNEVKQTYDDFILSVVKEYQLMSELKSKDMRIENLMKLLAGTINDLNREYPSNIETIMKFPYQLFPMVKIDDIILIKDYVIRPVGQVDSNNPLAPATTVDLDLFVRRTEAFKLFLTNKFNLLPRETKTEFGGIFTNLTNSINDSIQNTNEFKKQIGSMKPETIPVLKRMMYLDMVFFSAGKFIWPPELATKQTGPIQTENLPIPKRTITAITETVQTKLTPDATGKAPICPSCPPPPKPCPVPPEGKKYSETVRDLLIENALVKAYGGEYLLG
jgi:hypothetical protein